MEAYLQQIFLHAEVSTEQGMGIFETSSTNLPLEPLVLPECRQSCRASKVITVT